MAMISHKIPPFLIKAHRAEHDLNVHDPLMDLLSRYHLIRLPDDMFSEKLTWCLANCQNKFRDLSDAGERAWYFQNAQDAAMFAMKWV